MAAMNPLRKFVLRNILANRRRHLSTAIVVRGGYPAHGGEVQMQPIHVNIGKREVVGFGLNGEENYVDHIMAPFPAIRFKEDDAEILKLREKEKGDWKKMTVEEKKQLYRASFAQTFSELYAPTGEWKSVLGICLTFLSLGLWGVIWLKMVVYDPLPETITSEEHQRAQIKRMIDMRQGAVEGFTKDYDYEKNDWKK